MRHALLLLAPLLLTACSSANHVEGNDGYGEVRPVLITHAVLHGQAGDAVLVTGDALVAGAEAELRAKAPDAEVVDAQGGLVLPGFTDAHAHVLMGGLSADQVDLEGLKTPEECAKAVGAWAKAHADAAWIEGRGWSYDIVKKGEFPTRQALDAAVPDRPVFLEAYDGHSYWANSKALALARLGPDTQDPPNGRIVREADGKTPQGALLEDAAELVKVPEPPRNVQLDAIAKALDTDRRLGITRVHAICAEVEEAYLFGELNLAHRLPVEVLLGLPLATTPEVVRKVEEQTGLTVAFLKGFLDGVVESRTAFMLEPYVGTTERGKPNYEKKELFELVDRAHAAGIPVALHAVGDAAVRLSLDAYEAAAKAHPDVKLHHRIEHLEVVHPDDLPRFAKLGVIASMQPYHAVPLDAPSEDDVWSANLGPVRLSRAFPWRALHDAGATLLFGSDWPVMTQDPLRGLAVALTRQNERGLPAGGWQPQNALDLDTALAAYRGPGAVVLSPGARLDEPKTLWAARVQAVVLHGAVHRSTDGR